MCNEPQTQIPDLIIWMISNGERIAYYKAPIHRFLSDKKNPGLDCNKFRSFQLKYLGNKSDRTACLLKCFCWFGNETDYYDNYDLPSDSRITVYADTFENQTWTGSSWGTKGLSRPEFSGANGLISLSQTAFKPPENWEWTEEWEISIDFSSIVGDDYSMSMYTDLVFEVQIRGLGKAWTKAKTFWMTAEMEETRNMVAENTCPPGWQPGKKLTKRSDLQRNNNLLS